MSHHRTRPDQLAADRPALDDLALEYLGLLARQAGTVEFEGPLVAARAAGLPSSAMQRVTQLRALALEVHRQQTEQRRRELGLSALFETAGDLAALKDLDAVLEAIAARARSLLGSDVSYLTLNDDDAGDTYMRVTNGIVSQSFKDCRMNFGEGLGGKVAESATPYWTDDYFHDHRFMHTGRINGAVSDEGLTAILGVPLQLGPQVIGVLYAANRSSRAFSRDDVNLLCSLAAHAAVAIDSARLLAETRAALDDLRDTSVLLKRHVEWVERAADAHDRLAAIVVEGGSAEDVVHDIQQVVGGEISVLDPDGSVVASTRWRRGPKNQPERCAEALSASAENRTIVTQGLCAAPVQVGTGAPSVLMRTGGDDVDDGTRRILERAATVTALLLVVRRSVADTEARLRGDLLGDVISGEVAADSLRERARRLGVDLDRPHAVVVVDAGEYAARASHATDHLAAVEHGLSTRLDQRVVVVLPGRTPEEAGDLVARQVAGSRPGTPDVTVGAAGPAEGPVAVASRHAEAQRCVDSLLALGRRGDVASARDLGFVGLLIGGGGDIPGFVADRLSPVLDYDSRKGSDLANTLHHYFAQGQHLGRTARALQVHPNTVTQRLERVTQLLGPGWQEPEDRLELQLALRLLRLRVRRGSASAAHRGRPTAGPESKNPQSKDELRAGLRDHR